ncbi:hypothetical protein GAY28_03745 [Azospirillum brasilense]|nr:hypothetical protein [Azospirillum brasilense]
MTDTPNQAEAPSATTTDDKIVYLQTYRPRLADEKAVARRMPIGEAPTANPRDTPARRIGVIEDTRLQHAVEVIEQRIQEQKTVPAADRLTLPLNMRNLLVELQNGKRLAIRDVAREKSGRTEYSAIEKCMLPFDVKDEADFLARAKQRALNKKVGAYLRIAEIAAKLAGMDRKEALVRLFEGTSYMPDSAELETEERRALRSLAGMLQRIPDYLEREGSLRSYFERLDAHQVLPWRNDQGGFDILSVDDYSWWDHHGLPQIRVARRWVEQRDVEVLVTSITPGDRHEPVDWDELWSTGDHPTFQKGRAKANLAEVLSVGVILASGHSRPMGAARPVAIIEREIELSFRKSDFKDLVFQRHDAFTPGWRTTNLQTPAGPRVAAWRVPDLRYEPSDDEDNGLDPDDRPPFVEIHTLDVGFLSKHWSGHWYVAEERVSRNAPFAPGSAFSKVFWSMGESCFGAECTLPAILDRAIRADHRFHDGLISMIVEDYRRRTKAVEDWLRDLGKKTEAQYAAIDARYSGREMPDAENAKGGG